MMDDLKPEEKVEIQIGAWATTEGCQVYYNRKSKKFDKLIPNYKIFNVLGTRRKPDMVIFIPKLNQYIALELKDADKSINIRKGSKILDYYDDYTKGEAVYQIENKTISINHFLVASNHSPEGHIFKDEILEDNRSSKNSGKIWACKNHKIPYNEFDRTGGFIRQLWVDWNRMGKSKLCGVGVLLSGVLDEEEKCPAIFSEVYTNRWNQYWKKIK